MSLDVPRFLAVAVASIALCCGCSDRQAFSIEPRRHHAASTATDAGVTALEPNPAAPPNASENGPERQWDAATLLGSGNDSDPDAAAPPAAYANVTAVTVTGPAGALTFGVSVSSADVDCSQFADWWEVLGTDGALLYRRVLTHSHTDENGTTDVGAPGNTFTRDGGPIAIETSTTVLVRAHMNRGGYRGQVLRGSADGGFAPATDLPLGFASDVERLAPQPTGCSF